MAATPSKSAAFLLSTTTSKSMSDNRNKPIAIFYEHPDWFRPLFAELDRRGIQYVKIDANAHTYDPREKDVPYSLVFNRASPSAYLRSDAESTFFALDWIRYLERRGVEVVNGSKIGDDEANCGDRQSLVLGGGWRDRHRDRFEPDAGQFLVVHRL